jgi:nucleoid-associated protein YgaU
MSFSRYRTQKLVSTSTVEYQKILENRNTTNISHYSFDKFKALKLANIPSVVFETYIWSSSDRFYKLAHKYYGDPQLWWIIAFFNNTPLESDVKLGQKLLIPTPLEVVISALGV